MTSATQVRSQVHKLTSEEKTHILARAGFAARAVLYGTMGIFALLFSYGNRGGLTDVSGVLRKLVNEPFGAVILSVLGLGLLAYAIFRIAQAIRDYEGHGHSAKGVLRRIGYFAAGILHLCLGYSALNLVLRLSAGENRGGASETLHFGFWSSRSAAGFSGR